MGGESRRHARARACGLAFLCWAGVLAGGWRIISAGAFNTRVRYMRALPEGGAVTTPRRWRPARRTDGAAAACFSGRRRFSPLQSRALSAIYV